MPGEPRHLSRLEAFAFRGAPHQDLKQLIQDFAGANKFRAAAIITAVGSLEQLNLRYANQQEGTLSTGYFEIVSLVGTVSTAGCHLHLSAADESGTLVGGHLLEGNLIYTTAEIVIASLPDLIFERRLDTTYNYRELLVTSAPRS